ncbi:non-homologous end-joining DNA ligase [Desulforamulus ruminis]|uniref:DNA polymerase LigD, polymerase domain protein n=1 Tax=Desulforamulus ruminis (strain ATCC 23193 / DSM 2154 / NCIMB 8452 / DL) TaxID=696281 RepID=F6DU47_DESRL|nr:non-homologous end-joining DNA ligase [Desulforamulus ruminis]AEG60122.1 DNA polymerase LigD, polymerase domain protein [Desulforamulus ruminis DSM 2154]
MAAKGSTEVSINGRVLKLTNLDKQLWPEGLTKAHLVKYYTDIAPYLLPLIKDRPLVMKRYPHGIEGEYFYQKECPEYAPEWIHKEKISHSGKDVRYVICNDLPTLIWLINQGCIEIHGWLSKRGAIEYPDVAVIDLDPGKDVSFQGVMEVALVVKKTLDQLGLKGFPKTSGASGIHVFIPLEPGYTFREATKAMGWVAKLVTGAFPEKATIERVLTKRRPDKVYVDYLQNTRGKTMAWTYSLRPLPGAPVSTPLLWEEIEKFSIHPAQFTMDSIFHRIKIFGDIAAAMNLQRQTLDSIRPMVSF